jgi:hypothetical protein
MWGLVLLTAPGRARDEPAGAAALGAACEDGFSPACEYLGHAYRLGTGVPREAGEAAALYQRACDDSVFDACFRLAELYEKGEELPRDKTRAVRLYRRACDGGMDAACSRVSELQSVNPTDLELGTDRAAADRLDQAIQPYIRKARSTYPAARARYLTGLLPGQSFFVTIRLHDKQGRFEQIFLRVLGIAEGHVEGTIESEINTVSGYRRGQRVTVREPEILDWTISHPDGSEEGNVVGKFIDTYRPE